MAIPLTSQMDLPPAELLPKCVFCLKPTNQWTDLPGRMDEDQIACCTECGDARNPEEVPTNFQWRMFVRALRSGSREPKPYVGPWFDKKHVEIAAKGLCYREACGSTANHAWRNKGMGNARYCTTCVRNFNDGQLNKLCVPDIDFALALPLA